MGISPLKTIWCISLRSALLILCILDVVTGIFGLVGLTLFIMKPNSDNTVGALNGTVEVVGLVFASITIIGVY